MVNIVLMIVVLCGITNCSSATSLLYSVSQTEPQNGFVKTDIMTISVENGERKVVFSDEHSDIVLLPPHNSYVNEVMVTASGHLFARGISRSRYPGGLYEGSCWRGCSTRASIYELTVDGSNKYRKLFDIEGEQHLNDVRRLFANELGTKIGYVNMIGEETYLFVHDSKSGSLLHRTSLSKFLLDCFVFNIGWLKDGKVFLNVDTIMSPKCESKGLPGNYVMTEDGETVKRIPSKLAAMPTDSRIPNRPYPMIGEFQDSYLFQSHSWTNNPSRNNKGFLIGVNPVTGSRSVIPFRTSPGSSRQFFIAAAQKLAAFVKENDGDGISRVWIKNFESNEEKELFSFPFRLGSNTADSQRIGVIGWLAP
jgi:hypothetical protein